MNALDGGAQGITNGADDRIYAASGDQFVSFPANNPSNQDEDTIDGMGARGVDGADGKIWIADFNGSDIVRVNPNGENFKRFNVRGGPQQVADGPNGLVAYTNPGDDPQTVGRIDGNDVKKTKDKGSDPFGIAFEGKSGVSKSEFSSSGRRRGRTRCSESSRRGRSPAARERRAPLRGPRSRSASRSG